jgi:hypothetical protein
MRCWSAPAGAMLALCACTSTIVFGARAQRYHACPTLQTQERMHVQD